MDDDDSNMGVLFTGLNRAMSGALNASNDNITNFLSQMFAILAISTSMQKQGLLLYHYYLVLVLVANQNLYYLVFRLLVAMQ